MYDPYEIDEASPYEYLTHHVNILLAWILVAGVVISLLIFLRYCLRPPQEFKVARPEDEMLASGSTL